MLVNIRNKTWKYFCLILTTALCWTRLRSINTITKEKIRKKTHTHTRIPTAVEKLSRLCVFIQYTDIYGIFSILFTFVYISVFRRRVGVLQQFQKYSISHVQCYCSPSNFSVRLDGDGRIGVLSVVEKVYLLYA